PAKTFSGRALFRATTCAPPGNRDRHPLGCERRPPVTGQTESRVSSATIREPHALSNNHASFIWGIADLLRGSFKAHQYGDIILPFTVLRRLDAVLAPTKQAVYEAVQQAKADGIPVRGALLRGKAGHEFS